MCTFEIPSRLVPSFATPSPELPWPVLPLPVLSSSSPSCIEISSSGARVLVCLSTSAGSPSSKSPRLPSSFTYAFIVFLCFWITELEKPSRMSSLRNSFQTAPPPSGYVVRTDPSLFELARRCAVIPFTASRISRRRPPASSICFSTLPVDPMETMLRYSEMAEV